MTDEKFEALFIPAGQIMEGFTAPLQPTTLVVTGSSETLLTFTHDGQIIIGKGLTPDEAGKQAIEAMRHQLKWMLDDVRRETLDRAAKVAEAQGDANAAASFQGEDPFTKKMVCNECYALARAIRALAQEEKET